MEPIWSGSFARPPYSDPRLTLDFARQSVTLDGAPVPLTSKEFALFSLLVARCGEVLPRKTLLRAVWGYDQNIRTRTLDVHLARVRKKLGQFGYRHLETVCGSGCRFQPSNGIDRSSEADSLTMYASAAAL